ncbi:YceI family protein [Microvirga sp. STR05]|uniref:YceI family protein n=1 Tax=Hymenobacter duratus TaxID=2771356 RepID=A0ABR8JHS9_9BACT|nr:YceI family protein [Hymenobacter duratus]MBD2714902.1 YceI family protein [Hymenobacter duratus]MBR7949808.1 YceI family protein [Microvirga sp. STR05]
MKLLLSILLLFCTLAATPPTATSYSVNLEASRISWTGYAEVGTYAPTGSIQFQRGRFNYDGSLLRNGRFEVDMRTIRQEQDQLAEHLRGPDFFDVEKYPVAVFVLSEVRQGIASGQLTVRGVTQPVRFPLTVERQANGRLRIQGTATLDRTKFGINHNSSSFFQNLGSYAIRNDFKLTFDVVAEVERQ